MPVPSSPPTVATAAARRPARTAARAPLGPGTLLWRHAADLRSLLPGAAAGLMQLMHPGIGAGVTEHSAFFDAPFDRIHRSVPQIWATILAPDGTARARTIRDLHRAIGGVDERARRYHALEPETFWWAHATFTWEIFKAAETFHPGTLTTEDHEQMYAETVTWYSRYGVSMRPVPADYAAFQSKFWHVCTRTLELTPAAARALEIAKHGSDTVTLLPVGGARLDRAGRLVIERPLRLITFGCLPQVVRDRFDIPWSPLDQARFAALALANRQGYRMMPTGLNHWALRSMLRYIGAQTRQNRYQPAA
ncbi:oxygenase MpaB family protein [Actinomadura sp. K4S16]|uniref:oxygenase MpaB family protein n=1 Tax=Actinomadura sp. K4S16 TaxID=1316147 RepID=UPI0011EC78A2|nr:oxygenase MpaB family protein [Actinomadura sp. K4S16]